MSEEIEQGWRYVCMACERPQEQCSADPCESTLRPTASVTERPDGKPRMTDAQRDRLWTLCGNYKVPFREDDYFLRDGWAEGWVGGRDGDGHAGRKTIYVGVSPEGESHS